VGQISNTIAAEGEVDQSVVLQNFEIGFNPLHNTDRFVRVDYGGKRLVDFQNLGIFEVGEGEVIFKALLTIEFSTNVYTAYTLNDVYTYVNQKEFLLRFLKLISDDNWVDSANRRTVDYNAHADEFVFANPTTGTSAKLVATGVDDLFNLGINYVNFEEKYLQVENADNSTLKINIPIIEPVECRVAGGSVRSLDTYQDLFVGETDAYVEILDLRKDTGYGSQSGEAKNELTGKMSDLNLGVWAESAPYITTALNPQTDVPIQGSAIILSPGKILQKSGDNNFSVQITNKPQVSNWVQNLIRKYSLIEVDTKDGVIIKDAGIRAVRDTKETTRQRIVGYRVDNSVLQHNFTVDFICYSHVEMDPQDQEYYLENPEFVKGDVIWDISLFGTTGASIVFTEPNSGGASAVMDWLGQYWWVLVIVGIGGFLFYMFKGQMEAAAWKKALT
jgi:hypothetical protein